jgi:hypothetical protein
MVQEIEKLYGYKIIILFGFKSFGEKKINQSYLNDKISILFVKLILFK